MNILINILRVLCIISFISIGEELPPMDKFVTCFYDSGETMVYRRISIPNSDNQDWFWTMRDGVADRTPKEGKITHWLKEVENEDTKFPHVDLNYTSSVMFTIGTILLRVPTVALAKFISMNIESSGYEIHKTIK